MNEEWRDISGHPGYQVSSAGRVRSLDRMALVKNRWGGMSSRTLPGRVLKPQPFTNGYLSVHLGRGPSYLVHRLVCAAFVSEDNNLQVNHKNGQRQDNRVENLEWVTCSDNHKHSYRELTRKKHKLTVAVELIGQDHSVRFDSALNAARFLEVSPGSISSASLRNHKCKGYEVRYV